MREVPEWIGKHDDQPIPPRVRLRVFARYNGICHFSGRRITPSDHWDIDHIVALINGGEHRESNMAPILVDKPHKEKTAHDMAIKSKNARVQKKHFGVKRNRTIRTWRRFDGTPVYASRER